MNRRNFELGGPTQSEYEARRFDELAFQQFETLGVGARVSDITKKAETVEVPGVPKGMAKIFESSIAASIGAALELTPEQMAMLSLETRKVVKTAQERVRGKTP